MGEPERVTFTFNGASCHATPGESLAAALLSSGVRSLRRSRRTGEPRGVYCGIGLCFDCIVTVDGRPNARACMTLAEDGMRVESPAAAIGPQA
jgi:aerobic-type carbon monoxide dehydrogenase small subunit (CoxS/CutS family)